MDIKKFKLNNQRQLDEVFKKLASLTFEPKMYGQMNGELIFGPITSYVFSREAKIYWNDFLIQILNIKQLENYVSIKTANDLFRPYLENYLVGNQINAEEFSQKSDELLKYKTNKNFHYFIVYGFITKKVHKFSNIKIGKFEAPCSHTGLSFLDKIKKNNNDIITYRKANGNYSENDSIFNEILVKVEKFKQKTVIEIQNFGDHLISEQKSINDAEHFINELIFLRSLCNLNPA